MLTAWVMIIIMVLLTQWHIDVSLAMCQALSKCFTCMNPFRTSL